MMRKLRIIPFEEGILGGYHSHNKPGGGEGREKITPLRSAESEEYFGPG